MKSKCKQKKVVFNSSDPSFCESLGNWWEGRGQNTRPINLTTEPCLSSPLGVFSHFKCLHSSLSSVQGAQGYPKTRCHQSPGQLGASGTFHVKRSVVAGGVRECSLWVKQVWVLVPLLPDLAEWPQARCSNLLRVSVFSCATGYTRAYLLALFKAQVDSQWR